MSITKLAKLNKKCQPAILQEIREKMGIKTEDTIVIFTRGDGTILLTTKKYA